ncbi:MAG: hypothetical protein KJZ77_05740 [Anaerolineales bacterium]|nr:hypothetical protein [Anaerolineales bacterium]
MFESDNEDIQESGKENNDLPESDLINTGGGAYIGGDFETDEMVKGKVLVQGDGNIVNTNVPSGEPSSHIDSSSSEYDNKSLLQTATVSLLVVVIILLIITLIVVIITPGFIFDELCVGMLLIIFVAMLIKSLKKDLKNTPTE